MSHRAGNPQVCDDDEQGGRLRPASFISGNPGDRTIEACERELARCKAVEIRLRDALAECEARIRQRDELIQQQELLRSESDHRLLNDLQMTISLLSLQSRASTSPEAAAQLAVAADRVAMIARIHHRLNVRQRVQAIAFKQFLAEFAHDFSTMVSPEGSPERIVVEGTEIHLPAATVIPLGFIACELITNAAKHGKSRIVVHVGPDPPHGYVLSVTNDGPALPEGFDPGAAKGLGMRIVQSFVKQIDGELRFGRAEDGHGARFTVLFPAKGAHKSFATPAGGRD